MPGREGINFKRIRSSVAEGLLSEPFTPRECNSLLGIKDGWLLLSSHRVDNPGGEVEHFVRVSHPPALYRLKDGWGFLVPCPPLRECPLAVSSDSAEATVTVTAEDSHGSRVGDQFEGQALNLPEQEEG